jgi:hypothetical protein
LYEYRGIRKTKQTSEADVLARDKKYASTDIVAILRLLSLAECA